MIAEFLSTTLQRARARDLPVMELLNAAGRLQAEGGAIAVPELYRTWVEHNADNPLLYAVQFNYAVILSGNGDLNGARHALSEAIRINPDFYPPYINLGHVFERLNNNGEAVTQWYAASNRLAAVNGDNVGYKTAALKQVGRLLEKSNFDAHAEDALRLSLEINSNQSDVIQHWVSLRQRQCKWPVIRPWANITRYQLLDGISSLSLAAHTDDPLLQLANSYIYAKVDVGQPKVSFRDKHSTVAANADPKRRKVGYLSSDLREHAVGFLTSELYGLHDRSRIEVFVYYCGIPSSDDVYTRIKDTSDHWLDINSLSDEAAAAQMAADGIEILVDLNGYTNGARSKLLSMNPAPIIVNWLGFPGSLGSPYHHYIIADDFIIPPGDELYYSEKVLRVPCYQPNDRKRVISKVTPTRAEMNLPEDATVFCCFNGVHKITTFTWSRWMEILKQVPNSVLWLLEGIETTNTRLKELATNAGVAPERIIFAAKRRNPDHLARYPLADLFLDTSPYGAHTTCSDAMWMGVPVLTLAGRSFAARVCGSLIKSAGMEELICTTPEQYVARAVEYGSDRAKCADLRAKLVANRDTCILFDTPLLASSLEGLYAEMWAEYLRGETPRPDLTNLDIYSDIGIDLDRDDVELLAIPDYVERYRAKLAEKDAFSYLPADRRLWRGGARTLPVHRAVP